MQAASEHCTPLRRWRLRAATAVALLFCFLPLLPGQAAPSERSAVPAEIAAKLQKRGDLSLTNTTLQQALFTIGETWGINIVIGNEVQGNVNGVFKNAPLHEILDSVLLANGYSYRPVGQGLVVMKLDALGELNPMFESATISLKSVKPEDILAGCQLLASPKGRVLAVPSAKSLLVVDFPDRIAAMKRFVMPLEEAAAAAILPITDEPNQQPQVAYFSLYHVKAAAIKESVQSMLSKDGKLSTIEPDNKLVVIDYVSSLRLVEQALRKIDVPRPQVRIRAYIYDVSIEDLENLGINWNSAVKSSDVDAITNLPNSKFAIDSLTLAPQPVGSVGGAMTFMSLSKNFDITAVVNLLNTAKDSRLLADPMVTVLDREQASIQIVQELPYQQLTQTAQGGNIGTTAFRDAGVSLTVTPSIGPDGTITMLVSPSFSALSGYTKDASAQPIIDKREAKTTVRVADRQTFAIGGLRQRSDTGTYSGLPYLKDMKVIGKLFQSRSNTVRESELLVFLTPEIVTPDHPIDPREQINSDETHCLLERVPLAGQTPFPHCPCPPGAPPGYYNNMPSPGSYAPPGESVAPPSGQPLGSDPMKARLQFDHRGPSPIGPQPVNPSQPPANVGRPTGIAPANSASFQPAARPPIDSPDVGPMPPAVRVELPPAGSPRPTSATAVIDRATQPAPPGPGRSVSYILVPTGRMEMFRIPAVTPETASPVVTNSRPSNAPVEVRPQSNWQPPQVAVSAPPANNAAGQLMQPRGPVSTAQVPRPAPTDAPNGTSPGDRSEWINKILR